MLGKWCYKGRLQGPIIGTGGAAKRAALVISPIRRPPCSKVALSLEGRPPHL